MQADRPNILVIQADQLAATAIGAYHNPIAQTPHKVYSKWAYEGILGYRFSED